MNISEIVLCQKVPGPRVWEQEMEKHEHYWMI